MNNKLTYSEFFSEFKSQNFNIFITATSFEERSSIIPDLIKNEKIDKKIILFNANEVPEIVENAHIIAEKLDTTHIIQLNSDNPIENYTNLDRLTKMLSEINDPKIFIDTTTFTHETLLVIIRLFSIIPKFKNTIVCGYVGAREYSFNTPNDEDKWLSKGIKKIRTVLGYSGFTDPTHKNHLIVLFGFESERTKQIIDAYEYDVVTLGFGGDTPIQNNHLKINMERHKKLLNDYPNAQEFAFSLVDPYQTKQQILDYISKTKGLSDMNTVIAPLNNKISTIGAALAAIENEDIQLAYAKPNLYNYKGYAKANNDIYMFRLNFKS